MKVTSRVIHKNLKILDDKAKLALIKSVDALKSDVINEQVMPFAEGNLQNKSMFVDDSNIAKGFVLIRVDAPYGRRLYFHPEYNFRTDMNPNAQGLWFNPWIIGDRKNFLIKAFAEFYKEELKSCT